MATQLDQSQEGARLVYLTLAYVPGDTSLHDPTTDPGIIGWADNRLWKGCTVIAASTLNQAVTVHINGSLSRAAIAGQVVKDVESSFQLAAYSSGDPIQATWFLHPDVGVWLPFLYASLQAAVGPTSGALSIYVYKSEYRCFPDPTLVGS